MRRALAGKEALGCRVHLISAELPYPLLHVLYPVAPRPRSHSRRKLPAQGRRIWGGRNTHFNSAAAPQRRHSAPGKPAKRHRRRRRRQGMRAPLPNAQHGLAALLGLGLT